MRCTKCGNRIDDSAKFCKYCGSPLLVGTEDTFQENAEKRVQRNRQRIENEKAKREKRNRIIVIVSVVIIVSIIISGVGKIIGSITNSYDEQSETVARNIGDGENKVIADVTYEEGSPQEQIESCSSLCTHINEILSFMSEDNLGESRLELIEGYINDAMWSCWDSSSGEEYLVSILGRYYYDNSIEMGLTLHFVPRFPDALSYEVIYDGIRYKYTGWYEDFENKYLLNKEHIDINDRSDWQIRIL